MYDPTGNSKDREVSAVAFEEAEPPGHLKNIVHRYIWLKNHSPLRNDYMFHALPDACTYAIFDQSDVNIAGLTRLKTSSEELNLGTEFHFVNVRFLPGVWQQERSPVGYGFVDSPYRGPLPLVSTNQRLRGLDFSSQQRILTDLVGALCAKGLLRANPVTQAIFEFIDSTHTVADMARAAAISPRQLQRLLKRTTGFRPHDFLKVLRLQQSLRGEPSLAYADQSHFIHSFKKATGYTPGEFAKKFDV